jgi:hypothetical protein
LGAVPLAGPGSLERAQYQGDWEQQTRWGERWRSQAAAHLELSALGRDYWVDAQWREESG